MTTPEDPYGELREPVLHAASTFTPPTAADASRVRTLSAREVRITGARAPTTTPAASARAPLPCRGARSFSTGRAPSSPMSAFARFTDRPVKS